MVEAVKHPVQALVCQMIKDVYVLALPRWKSFPCSNGESFIFVAAFIALYASNREHKQSFDEVGAAGNTRFSSNPLQISGIALRGANPGVALLYSTWPTFFYVRC